MAGAFVPSTAVLKQLADPVTAQVAPVIRNADLIPFNRTAPIAKQVLARDVLDAGRTVISEEAYAEALGAVIEREFYPDLGRLQQQLQWLKALESGDAVAIADAKANISQSVRRVDQLAVGTTPAPVGGSRRTFLGGQTPLICSHNTRSGAAGDSSSVVSSRTAPGSSVLDSLSLGAFQSTFVSEDTAGWSANMARAQAERARAHWWTRMHTGSKEWQLMLTDGHAGRVAGEAGTLLLRDQAGRGVDLSEDRGLGVDVKGRVRSWRYRPRNALFFGPELATSYDISRVQEQHRRPNPDLSVAMLSDGHARDTTTGQVGLGPAGAAGLLKDVAQAEHAGAASDVPKLLADARTQALLLPDQPTITRGSAREYSMDDLDTGRYTGTGAASSLGGGGGLSASFSGLDLVLPSSMIRGPRLRASGGVVQPAAIARKNTRLPGAVLLEHLGDVRGASGVGAATASRAPADPLSLPEFRGYALLPTPIPVLQAQAMPPSAWGQTTQPQTAMDMAAAMGIRPEDQHSDGGSSFSFPASRAREGVRDALLDKMGAGKKRRREEASLSYPPAPGSMPPPPGIATTGVGASTRHKTPVFAAAQTPSSLLAGGVLRRAPGAGTGAVGSASSVLGGGRAHSTVTGLSRGTAATAAGGGGNLRAALASMTPAARRIAAQVAAQAAGGGQGVGLGLTVAGSTKLLGTSRGSSQAR